MVIGSYMSIITLNVNGLNAPTRRDWWDGYKNKTHIHCLKETHRRPRDTYRWKVRGWEKVFHANRNQKKVGPAILIIRQNRLQYKWKNWAPREVEHLVQSHTDEMAGLGLKPMPPWTLELFRTHQNTSQAGRSRHNQQLISHNLPLKEMWKENQLNPRWQVTSFFLYLPHTSED